MTQAKASPTKKFFTEMLTRDIELADAVLDLLDNCIDGVVRGSPDGQIQYTGKYAHISFDGLHFKISDNCGGIPRKLAEEDAFRLGKSPEREAEDEKKQTVGVYGIGMKRALFKLGKRSEVTSVTATDKFKVDILPEWLSDDENWLLPLDFLERDQTEPLGTTILVTDLNLSVVSLFENSSFRSDLRDSISKTYALIISKGFEIIFNGKAVLPKPVRLLFAGVQSSEGETNIQPYLYKATFGEVDVNLAVGFYTTPPSPEELDIETDTPRLSENAGWTIICNDRVVLYCDRSRLTGWGEAGVPNFHTQFINIAGVVQFTSKNVKALPLTTTKRGVDASSDLYLRVKDVMREGLKKFTSFTNIWKKEEDQGASVFVGSRPLEVSTTFATISSTGNWTPVRGRPNEFRIDAHLPTPLVRNPNAVIRYTRPKIDIDRLAKILFEEDAVKPSRVGEECFDIVFADNELK